MDRVFWRPDALRASRRFHIVFRRFAQRDAAFLDELYPQGRASLYSCGNLALNLSLFHLGVASFVDSEWRVDVQLVVSASQPRDADAAEAED